MESRVFGIGVEVYTAGSADWKTLQNQGKFTQLLVQQEGMKPPALWRGFEGILQFLRRSHRRPVDEDRRGL